MNIKNICITAAIIMLSATEAMAQWRLGATVGASCNKLSIDTQYQYDWRYDTRWGAQAGVAAQYDVTSWMGVRAELNFQQKGYTMRRTENKTTGELYRYRDNYLSLPLMASFSFGGQKVRGFVNAGVYGGYWLYSHTKGYSEDLLTEGTGYVDSKVELTGKHDQRLDFGYVGGVGVEYRVSRHWAAQVEARYYHSVVSKKKQYQAMKDYQYNSTLGLTAGVFYVF